MIKKKKETVDYMDAMAPYYYVSQTINRLVEI